MKPSSLSERVAIMEAQIAALCQIVGAMREDLPETVKLADYTAKEPQRMLRIAREFAAINGLRVADLKGASTKRPISWARQDLMALLHSKGHASTSIGRFLGGRDHTTVLYGIKASRARAGR